MAQSSTEYSFVERLADQLDRDHPNWFLEWASADELNATIARFGSGNFEKSNMLHEMQELRWRIAHRFFHTILHAAIGADIVEETISEKERQNGNA